MLISCNYKELRCVICDKKKKTSITKFETGAIRTIKKEKFIAKAIDTPVKTITKFKEFDNNGIIIKKVKKNKITDVWDFNFNKSREKVILYYPESDSIKKEISIFKNGELVSRKKVKK